MIRVALRGVLNELSKGSGDSRGVALEAMPRTCRAAFGSRSRPARSRAAGPRWFRAALEEARARTPDPDRHSRPGCDRDSVVKALDLGAVGFIESGERDVMLSALRLVFSGGVYIPPEILSRSEMPLGVGPSTAYNRRVDGSAPTLPADLGLTARQVDVLSLMMRGKSNKAICRILNLAEPTVKNHVTAILKALKASNRTEAVIMVGALGWKLPQLET